MSLDVSLYGDPYEVECVCPHCENAHKRTHSEHFFSFNITHNLGAMANAVGLYDAMWQPENIPATRAKDLIPYLVEGLAKLEAGGIQEYQKYEPPPDPHTGKPWGCFDTLLSVVREYLDACRAHPNARISTSR